MRVAPLACALLLALAGCGSPAATPPPASSSVPPVPSAPAAEELGGRAQVQAALRDLGNPTTRVDRVEPELNETPPGDPRDTSTPAGLGASVQQFVLGDVLAPDRRALLQQWLRDDATGDAAIRAGVPEGWEVGDKTGSGGYGTRNDVGVVEPDDGGAPLVVVLLTDRGVPDADSDDGLLADATRLVVGQLGRRGGRSFRA